MEQRQHIRYMQIKPGGRKPVHNTTKKRSTSSVSSRGAHTLPTAPCNISHPAVVNNPAMLCSPAQGRARFAQTLKQQSRRHPVKRLRETSHKAPYAAALTSLPGARPRDAVFSQRTPAVPKQARTPSRRNAALPPTGQGYQRHAHALHNGQRTRSRRPSATATVPDTRHGVCRRARVLHKRQNTRR